MIFCYLVGFSCSGDFKVKEIFNFTQDDLTTEDVLVLDCHREIYVWVGCHSNVRSKQQALTLGQKFLETDILAEGLSLEIPIYVVTEGYEPPFFTCFFAWDSLKANMCGSSFERKLAVLNGKTQRMVAPMKRNSLKVYSRETTPGTRSKPVGSNGLGTSMFPASSVFISKAKSSDNCPLSSPPIVSADLPTVEQRSLSRKADVNLLIFPYEQLKVDSNDPATGIDISKREAYLSEEEFQKIFGMTKRTFHELPKWRKDKLKMSLHLF